MIVFRINFFQKRIFYAWFICTDVIVFVNRFKNIFVLEACARIKIFLKQNILTKNFLFYILAYLKSIKVFQNQKIFF